MTVRGDTPFPAGMSNECRLLFERVRDIVLFVDIDGRIIEANEAAVVAYGRPREALLGLALTELRAPETLPALRTQFDKALSEGVLFETAHVRADGSRFPVEVSARRAEIGGVTGVLSIVRDVSERHRAQAEVEALTEDLSQIFETAADGMRIVDTDFNVVRANHTLAKMARVDPDAIAHGKCWETFAGELCHTPGCPLERVLAGEFDISVEVEKYRSDGSHVPCLLRARPYWRDGKVAGVVEDFRDITERRLAEATIRHMAFHDQLTGLPNRALFADRLSVALANAEREGVLMAALFLDIDSFKRINDTRGHAVGDLVLREVGTRLENLVRKGDTAARVGGDEFVVLLPHIDGPEDAEVVARKLVEGLSAPVSGDGGEIAVAVSVGIALHRPGDTNDELIRRADTAMYAAKQAGGSSYRFEDDSDQAVGA